MKISVVVPFYNEEEAISYFIEEIKESLKGAGSEFQWEFIFVDDGSTDNTVNVIQSSDLEGYKILSTPHLGLSHALFEGVDKASGDIIITIDADGQFCFKDSLRLIEILLEKKADIVTGYRVKRADSFIRVLSSRLANLLKRIIIGDNIIDSTCTLKAFRKDVKSKILYGFDGFHRFIPTFALINNLKLVEVPVEHRSRIKGEAKFGILDRLPDVAIDVLGVRWIKYKRFSSDSDERRYSFYPDLIFLIIFIYLYTGLFGNYFRVVDDFWLYGSLNRFIGYDYSQSYGWENFIFNEIVPPLIRFVYAITLNIGMLFGVKYPLEWSAKVIGVTVIFFSYLLLTSFFNAYFRRNLAKWISLLIVYYGVISSEIYSGLARSFSYILIPLLLIYMNKLSLIGLSVTTLITALVYPVLLPLFFISILLIYAFADFKNLYKAILPIFSGIIGLLPMLYKIDITAFSPATGGDSFLERTNAFELPLSSNFDLLFGSFKDISIVEWINFNFLHQWLLSRELREIIGISLILFLLSGICRRLIREKKNYIDIISFFILLLFFLSGFVKKDYVDKSYIFKWGILLSSIYILTGVVDISDIKRHKSISVFGVSSLTAFLITHILSQRFGFGVHEPGRQLQRAFAIIFPFLASYLFYIIYIKKNLFTKGIFYVSMITILLLFPPSLKLLSPYDKYVIERIDTLNAGSIILSHPLTANWIVSHTNKYSTIIDEQIRVTRGNPIRGSTERIMPTEMAAIVLNVYYGNDIQSAIDWCRGRANGFILVEEYYYSDEFFKLKKEPYASYVERNNPERNFALLKVPIEWRHPVTPEAYLISCEEITRR